MPALHVVGEIVGASGLRPLDGLSMAHWLDVLSLHPSSRRGFFCRWRLAIRAFGKRSRVTRDDTGKDDWSQWRVLEGASRGQTQVHAYSAITPLHETVTKSTLRPSRRKQGELEETLDDEEEELVELETLWCHPIDLHLAVYDAPPFPTSWPCLEFQVASLDELHCERLVGTASLQLPLAQHEFFLDLPLTTLKRSSVRDTIVDLLELRHERAENAFSEDTEEDENDENDESDLQVATSAGTLYVRFAIIQQGFLEKGIFS